MLGLDLLKKAEEKRAAEAKAAKAAQSGSGFTVVSESGEENSAVTAKILARAEAKKAKNFAEADRIRDELKAEGIELTDIPNGARWRSFS